ncbi:MAG: PrsW family intramembrane metalloprotease, partial [Actinomycetes bacterium]|nr:PrsW family intramembrane metalloprotease [Actinomycetes bacterium]MDX5380266.1 PrsW family intramembrane metalloprotease [Actinomycetes bacterium]MDX5398984.1 PrsW family intramembrane metalloprotease [Actinomycetes bacterium]MDX5449995.1 PrsW family intramembrane metalloprotease [Actinomycetes bacterium]
MIDVRNPVFWVVAALTGVGVVGLVPLLQAGFTGAPAGFILAVILWALFATFAWWLIRRLSRTRPRPRSATAAAFVWGAVAATGLGRWATGGTADILDALVADEASASALAAGISEELLKILGVAALSLVAASRMRSALDFIYYGAFVGLGFMTTESLLYAAEGASTS